MIAQNFLRSQIVSERAHAGQGLINSPEHTSFPVSRQLHAGDGLQGQPGEFVGHESNISRGDAKGPKLKGMIYLGNYPGRFHRDHMVQVYLHPEGLTGP